MVKSTRHGLKYFRLIELYYFVIFTKYEMIKQMNIEAQPFTT